MTTETSGRLGLAAAEAPLGLAEGLRGRAAGRRKRPEMGQERGLRSLVAAQAKASLAPLEAPPAPREPSSGQAGSAERTGPGSIANIGPRRVLRSEMPNERERTSHAMAFSLLLVPASRTVAH